MRAFIPKSNSMFAKRDGNYTVAMDAEVRDAKFHCGAGNNYRSNIFIPDRDAVDGDNEFRLHYETVNQDYVIKGEVHKRGPNTNDKVTGFYAFKEGETSPDSGCKTNRVDYDAFDHRPGHDLSSLGILQGWF